MTNPMMDPDKRRIRRENREQVERKLEHAQAVLQSALKRKFNDFDGKIILRFLMSECGHLTSDIVLNPQTQEINPLATVHNLARRSLCLKICHMLDPAFVSDVQTQDPFELVFEKAGLSDSK